MPVSAQYNAASVEEKRYQQWIDNGFFKSSPNPDKQPFTVLMPPANVTGILHMGHMLNNTIQDVLIRKARMEGKEACWVPGTDHASIATEAKVVERLRERGITKADITREEFLAHAHDWKDEFGGIILKQLKKLGASCDWDRTFFTMEKKNSDAVVRVFIDMYNKGYLYRDLKMVNWDPKAKTTLSNEEVIYREVDAALYHVRYRLANSNQYVTIATTRPETILADTAICINPTDDRYVHLKDKTAIVPLVDREIPIIEDEYVDIEFGTGCLKVTPAHDPNDYDLGQKHNLATIDILNEDATLSQAAQFYVGEDREVARRLIAKELKEMGLLVKTENLRHKVGYSERNPDTVVEPRLSLQWFVDMEKIATPAMENVMNDTIGFYPPKFKNTYKHWLENIRDWPISRQLWWGQQIPAFYYGDGDNQVAVAATRGEALAIAQRDSGNDQLTCDDLTQDQDVVDTWFSSWLLPISVFDGFENPDNEDMKYYYPTSVLVTGWDIIFFWVARMIIAGYEFKGERPFGKVYFTGMVRDMQRRKMSKSLGNSPDALKLIEDYSADGVRVGMLLSAAAGNDLLFDDKQCEQGRNFANKIWNAFRLVKGWESDKSLSGVHNETAIEWFEARYHQVLTRLEDHFEKFRLSDALMRVYKLVWDDFCSWYLEMIKPDYPQPIDSATYDATIIFLERLMKLVHPFMPFISEEIWQNIKERQEKDCVMVASWPRAVIFDKGIIDRADLVFEVVTNIRSIRNTRGISLNTTLNLSIKTADFTKYASFEAIIKKLANVSGIEPTETKVDQAVSFVLKGDEYFIPVEDQIDTAKEKKELQKKLDHAKRFLIGVTKKLGNERFVNGAPEKVVAIEQQKKRDTEARIKVLEENLNGL